ncbi:DNA-protecting protein DprA [bacterium]|nr:MAG: DNA-protecting protein DprA [bacterium]
MASRAPSPYLFTGFDTGTMADEKLKYWLALARVKGLGGASVKNLLERVDDPQSLFEDDGVLSRVPLPEEARLNIKTFSAWGEVESDLALANKHGVRVVPYHLEDYPLLLKEINDPPVLIYVKGDVALLNGRPTVAVVGTRRPTHYGLKMSGQLALGLAARGVSVVSGLARGCDSAAHKGALSAGGVTVAVLGTGIDVTYPPENAKLHEEIAVKGVVISEFPMGTKPQPYNFPRRNRIISGLSLGVVVVEASFRSGALMTARLALDYNRDVFAVPGLATSDRSMGTNKFIKDGAGLVVCAEDILAGLGIDATVAAAGGAGAPLTDTSAFGVEERLVFDALLSDELDIDTVAEKTGLSSARVSAALMGMELRGLIAQSPGMRFSRK